MTFKTAPIVAHSTTSLVRMIACPPETVDVCTESGTNKEFAHTGQKSQLRGFDVRVNLCDENGGANVTQRAAQNE